MSATIVTTAIDEIMQNHGFVKKSGSWYIDTQDGIVVIQVQKSQYGQSYYVNVGVWLKALGEISYPPEKQCHIRTRLTSILSDEDRENLTKQLDLTYSVDDDRRRELLTTILETSLISRIPVIGSLLGLRSTDARDFIRSSLVTGPAQALLATEA